MTLTQSGCWPVARRTVPRSRMRAPSVTLTSDAETGKSTTTRAPVFPFSIEGQQESVGPRHGDRETALGIGAGRMVAPGFHVTFVEVEPVRIALPFFNFVDFVDGDAVGVPDHRELNADGRAALRIDHAAGQFPGSGAGSRRLGNHRKHDKGATARQHGERPRKSVNRKRLV